MHLTEIEEAVREIARVLKPGGTFVTLHPLHFPAQNPFFAEWFEPLLCMVPLPKQAERMPGSETIPAALAPKFDVEEIRNHVEEVHYTDPGTAENP
ncbi:hypothetical protein GCM10010885_16850 [Alicyclobacillus cellulosilyticus]|uniref:Methyltransferase type 11 domain-containing protein n=1 Tax=Alicyclobacillus cellulosilyticus TaxID=1003997 RepID=A0A917KF69_9BACL|nr:hypothetical protein GCM10010885_16850 [Alicyclobacillus cellulosilyticus]